MGIIIGNMCWSGVVGEWRGGGSALMATVGACLVQMLYINL